MRHLNSRLPVLSLALVPALLLACTATGTGAARDSAPVSSADPTASPSPDCYGINESVDTPPLTIANLMPATTSVVVALLETIEPGVWNTKDGSNFNPGIKTLIDLQVTRTIVGDDGPVGLRVVNSGGTADCVVHNVSSSPPVEKGKTYVFFLQPSPDADGVRHPELPLILTAWPVNEDGTVDSEYDGTLSVDELAAEVTNPGPPSATPEPTPAGTANPG